MSFLLTNNKFYTDKDVIINKSSFITNDSHEIEYTQYIPPDGIDVKNIFLVVNDFDSDSSGDTQSFELAKNGISTININYRKDLKHCIDDVYESYLFFSKHYENEEYSEYDSNILTRVLNAKIYCDIGLIGVGIGSYIVLNLINKNNSYQLNPNIVILLSPVSNPFYRTSYFRKLIKNKELKYHHKHFDKIIISDEIIFDDDRNMRIKSRFIKTFESDCQIISVFYDENVFSSMNTNPEIKNYSTIFQFDGNYDSKNDYHYDTIRLIKELSTCRYRFINKKLNNTLSIN